MATRNIQMNYYNGSSYDQLYPQVNLTNITGVLPVANGGTGETSLAGLINQLTGQGIGKVVAGRYGGTQAIPDEDSPANSQTIILSFTPKAVLLTLENGEIFYNNGDKYFYGGLAVTGYPVLCKNSGITQTVLEITTNGFIAYNRTVSRNNWSTIVIASANGYFYHYVAVG